MPHWSLILSFLKTILIQHRAIGQVIKKFHENGEVEEVFDEHLPNVILVITYQRDHEGLEWLTLAWPRFGVWRTHMVERSVICDRAKIVSALSGRGAPVCSTNVSRVINWLMAFEKANIHVLPIGQASTQMGWQSSDGFLLGETWIDEEGEHKIDASDPKTWRPGSWALDSNVAVQIVQMCALSAQQAGTLEGWTNIVGQIIEFPRVLLALYASLAAPMISLLVGARRLLIGLALPVQAKHLPCGSRPALGAILPSLKVASSVGGIQPLWPLNAALVYWGILPLILNDSNKAPSWLPRKSHLRAC